MAYRFVVLCLALAVRDVWGNSAGAPAAACGDMIPQHHVEPQASAAPYNVLVNTKQVKDGQQVEITLQGKSAKDTIKGFLVQGRVGDVPVGTFDVSGVSQLAQAVDCGSGKGNTATHKKHEGIADPQTIVLKWNPPPGLQETVKFKATILLDGGTFWVGLLSNEVKVN